MAKRNKTKSAPINNLIVFGDTHCGDRLGMHPRETLGLDGGMQSSPSKLQLGMLDWWDEFWGEWVPQVTRGEPYAVCLNGDAIDGRHHGSVHQISQNHADQQKIAEALLHPIVEKCEGRFYFVRGTEAHVGQSGENEEVLAKALGAIPDDAGHFARNELWIRVGKALCHILHHVGVTSSSAHESSAVNAELAGEFMEAARWGNEIPNYVIRNHRHRCIVVDIDTASGYAAGIVCPGWQLKTSFAYKVAGGRITQPQCGGILVRSGDEEHYHRRWVKALPRPKEVTL